jgi:hypothetical protein
MHRIFLMPPIAERQSVTFRWRVEPETTLYRKTSFTMTFPTKLNYQPFPVGFGGISSSFAYTPTGCFYGPAKSTFH